MRRPWTAILLLSAFTLLAIISVACWPDAQDRDVPAQDFPYEERGVFPAGTATPLGYERGLIVWDISDPWTVYPGQKVRTWQFYPNEVQANATVTPNWGTVQAVVNANATRGVKTWLGSSMFDDNDPPATDEVRLPSGAPTVTYDRGDGCGNDVAPNYGNATFQDWYSKLYQSLFAEFDDDPNVAGYYLDPGVDWESLNVKAHASCPNLQSNFEASVSCEAFVGWHEDIIAMAAQYTTKPVTFQVLPPCNGSSWWYNNKRYAEFSIVSTPQAATPYPTPRYVGFRQNNWNNRDSALCWMYDDEAEWGTCQVLSKMNGVGGGIAHTDFDIVSLVATPQRESYIDDIAWRVLGSNAVNWEVEPEHIPYIRAHTLYVITATLGTDATDATLAALRFSSAQTGRTGSGTYTESGFPEPPGHLLEIVQGSPTPAPTRYGQTQFVTTPVAGFPYPYVVDVAAPTPGAGVAPEFVNYFGYPASTSIGLDVDDDWISVFDGTITVRYYDTAGDSFVLAYRSGGSTVTETYWKGEESDWQDAVFTVTGAQFDNGLPTGGDIELRTATGADLFYSILVEGAEADATPTPTATGGATLTPTKTLTPTPTGSPTLTRTPTSTPDLRVMNCPTTAVTVDGVLSEWSAVTPVPLSASVARYVAPPSVTPTSSPTPGGNTPTPQPVAADISANFYCAWSGTSLYVAGIITDSDVDVPAGSYRNGDSALVALDARGDGFNRFMQDDHDLYIPAPGAGISGTARILDYDSVPIGVTAVISDTAAGWQFELSIPAGIHNAGTLSNTDFVIYTFGLYDRDGGSTFQHELVAYKRRADLD